MTDAKIDMVVAAMTPDQQWIVEQVRDAEGPLQDDLVTVEEVAQIAARARPEHERRTITDKAVVAALKVAGAKFLGRIRLGGQGTPKARIWSLRKNPR